MAGARVFIIPLIITIGQLFIHSFFFFRVRRADLIKLIPFVDSEITYIYIYIYRRPEIFIIAYKKRNLKASGL